MKGTKNFIETLNRRPLVNPFISKQDRLTISPNNINAILSRQLMRVMNVISKSYCSGVPPIS